MPSSLNTVNSGLSGASLLSFKILQYEFVHIAKDEKKFTFLLKESRKIAFYTGRVKEQELIIIECMNGERGALFIHSTMNAVKLIVSYILE